MPSLCVQRKIYLYHLPCHPQTWILVKHDLIRFIPVWIQIIFIYFPLNISPYFHVSFPRNMYQRNSYVTSTHHRCMFKCLWYCGFKSSTITKRCSCCMSFSWIVFNLIWKESYLSYTTIMTFHFVFHLLCFQVYHHPLRREWPLSPLRMLQAQALWGHIHIVMPLWSALHGQTTDGIIQLGPLMTLRFVHTHTHTHTHSCTFTKIKTLKRLTCFDTFRWN